jgi:hypothetical protein
MAEEYFSRLRRIEIGIHRHIAGTYLRYTQESSWREDDRRASNRDQVIGLQRCTAFRPTRPDVMKNNSTFEFERLLGRAALALWPNLPRDVQETLFETAVASDDIVRNQLASYLHDHHPRTAHPTRPTRLA